MYKHICAVCGKDFESIMPHTKSCSDSCRNERYLRDTGRSKMVEGIPTSTIGAMSEMRVAVNLMEKGYSVFRALSAACFCDLIAIKDNKILKIEARTGYKSSATGNVCFPTRTRGNIDLYAVHFGGEGRVVFFEKDAKTIVEL